METGTANAVIRHPMNGERVQWHHATFGFPFASAFIKALNRDVNVPGLSAEMVRANQPTSLTKSIGRMIQQRQVVQSTKLKLAAVPEEPPEPSSFCEDIDSSEFSDPSLYHHIFTKLIATSDIVSADLSGQMQMQSIRGYQYVLLFIWNNYIHYEPMNS